MSQDIESQVIATIKEADFFAIQLDVSTDISGKAQLLKSACNGIIFGIYISIENDKPSPLPFTI